jgi:hypothetical protein
MRQRKPMDSGFAQDRVRDAKSRLLGSSKQVIEKKQEAPYPSENEPMLAHPWNNSIVKIRDNGTVDIFSEGDLGIRINRKAKTIDIYAQSFNQHTSFIRSFVKKDVIQKIKGNWTIQCNHGTIEAKGNVKIKANGKLEVESKGDMRFTTKGNVYYKAGGKYYFD